MRLPEIKLPKSCEKFVIPEFTNDSYLKKEYGDVFFDFCVKKKRSHRYDEDCYYVYAKPVLEGCLYHDCVCVFASPYEERVLAFIETLIPYEEQSKEETGNENKVHTDLEEVQGELPELQRSIPVIGDAGDGLSAGDRISADPGSTGSSADEPEDLLGRDPDDDSLVAVTPRSIYSRGGICYG